jgi:hypothetical protein
VSGEAHGLSLFKHISCSRKQEKVRVKAVRLVIAGIVGADGHSAMLGDETPTEPA